MASTLVACKIEEVQGRGGGRLLSRDIVLVYVHLYRRFRLGLLSSNSVGTKSNSKLVTARSNLLNTTNNNNTDTTNKQMTIDETRNILRYIRPMPCDGELYKCWEKEMFDMENHMLRELGFSLYWIPEGHPHVFLLYFLKVLEVDSDGAVGGGVNGGETMEGGGNTATGGGSDDLSVGQIAWNYCNDSCRLDFCVRYPPEVTACAAIYLACHQKNIDLPLTPRPWWQVFIGVERCTDLSNVCNALLALCCYDEEGDGGECMDGYRDALRVFVVSLVPRTQDGGGGGSFNDPRGEGGGNKPGFVWNSFD